MPPHRAQQRPPSLGLISSASPARPVSTSPLPSHRHSQSPFRYVHLQPALDEKSRHRDADAQLSTLPAFRHPLSISQSPTLPHSAGPTAAHGPQAAPASPATLYPASPSYQQRVPSSMLHQSAPLRMPYHQRYPNPVLSQPSPPSFYTRPRSLRVANLIRPWLPLILYGMTSLVFVVAIAFYRTELFTLLDDLAVWLRADKQFGHAVLFSLIFLTTIPPIPLYSTLIILSGYTFGPWTGAIISYTAALAGAITVFIISRTLLRDTISRWLASTTTIKRVVRAIEKRPKLLFLIRLAPYPYNVMNCLLAASPSLTLRTYTICTALSLFKVIIHTGVGASIHSFRDYHVVDPDASGNGQTPINGEQEESSADTVARTWTIIGVGLCVAILVYLSIVARKAVDDELEEEQYGDSEERLAFLSSSSISHDSDLEVGASERAMTETSISNGGQVFLLTQPRQQTL
ncbi:hypothetical protein PC9H_005182 [Pleurotus ostreatus]|uniref:Golgi apparatus membrane protein TVP38 n=2 Tax=Pleurotus ostreatus TaxID=5322 RepID=A0A8H7A3C9_PLEOS|nr:uncharacterized protein PC9H_005182 [Pleurotus ostreatus]KAF7433232.1 hypothetical protein PC9H_005182 [Pleurotus ostreatus]